MARQTVRHEQRLGPHGAKYTTATCPSKHDPKDGLADRSSSFPPANTMFSREKRLAVELTTIQDILLEHMPKLQALYLFGSRAAGRSLPNSDLDLALLLPPARLTPGQSLRLVDLRARCEEAVHGRVDLIDLRAASTALQFEVLAQGLRILTQDIRATHEFEMLALSKYQRLNEERRGIMARFLQTGRAYA